MFTVCSKCNLRLTVTATDLRAAQGYVRCGRCHNVFNALAALADDPARAAEQANPTDTQVRKAVTIPPPEPADEHTEPADTATDTSLEFNPASTNISEVFIEAPSDERTGTFESIILSGGELADDEFTTAAEPDPVAAAAAPAALTPQALSAPAPPVAAAATVIVDVQTLRDALAEPPVPVAVPARRRAHAPGVNPTVAIEIAEALAATDRTGPDHAQAEQEDPDTLMQATSAAALLEPPAPRPRVPRWLQHGGVAVLSLVLLAQLAHHYRAQLADTPVLHRPVDSVYQALGLPLEPRWDVASYEIRQLGASADAAATGNLVVRASISNHAKRVQPLPLLRVVMQDRFGNRVAGRDLQPAEYLGRGAPQVSLMAPGQRVDVQVAFQDPGQSVTGFEIDACMAARDRTVTCANDPGSR